MLTQHRVRAFWLLAAMMGSGSIGVAILHALRGSRPWLVANLTAVALICALSSELVRRGRSASFFGAILIGVFATLGAFGHAMAPPVAHALSFLIVLLVFGSLLLEPRGFIRLSVALVVVMLLSRGIRVFQGYGGAYAQGSLGNLSIAAMLFASVLFGLDGQHRKGRMRATESIQEAVAAREAAEVGKAAKGRFLANMSHELRTPLNAIVGYAEMLEEEVGPDQAGLLLKVQTAGRELLGHIDHLLEVARQEALGETSTITFRRQSASGRMERLLGRQEEIRWRAARTWAIGVGLAVVASSSFALLADGWLGLTTRVDVAVVCGAFGALVAGLAWFGRARLALGFLVGFGSVMVAVLHAAVPEARGVEMFSIVLMAVAALLLSVRKLRWVVVSTCVVLGIASAVKGQMEGLGLLEVGPPWLALVFTGLALLELVRVREHQRRSLLDVARAADRDLSLAAAAERAGQRFLEQASHEIRTPLTTILGYSELLAEEVDQESMADVDRIRRAGNHLLSIVNDVLDMQVLERGELTAQAQPVDLAPLCREVVDLTRPVIEANGNAVRLEVALQGEVTADPRMVRQILVNLMANAGKFTKDGHVELVARAATEGVLVQVKDTGPGISAVDQRRLFRPFERLEAHTSVAGTGLGLAIARHMAAAMGGDLRVSSKLGKGTCFELLLRT